MNIGLRHIVTMGACTFASAVTIFPQTSGLELYRQFKAKYRLDQSEEPVKEKFKIMFEEVMNDLKLNQKQREKLRIFNVYGYDVFHAGTMLGKRGGVVGIPINFEYESVDTINKNDIKLSDKPIPWHQQEAKDFLESLVLSENAKKFALAREILKLRDNSIEMDTLRYLSHFLLLFFIYNTFHKGMKLSERKIARFMIASAACVGGIASFIGLYNSNQNARDIKVDTKLSILGPEYIEGGKEFYEKLLKRNIALRTLLGENGKKLFTTNGNEIYFLWPNRLSIHNRKNFLESGTY
ncbi:transmembrane protein 177 [Hylaeus volcanicus]|uniref:transmembrane protein 177 n=1 Tax=Hylaeus volcanicus TaxID=313075 RepID=UPI0023B847B6|nr:transmembrane protein 177 [Hylaeus volcanicus]XP_053983704.1 transmembrane protein 177 [Hylaeus volcanicus]XP_053983707.1 transmembrane protein 177 [Hylaeus volcanicus]XP_053983708.1 transmembrane protein 177 [Hylaeus volcanicus]XP_053983709.1 transmembrane protein 177 [Hylaeus volcanicus]